MAPQRGWRSEADKRADAAARIEMTGTGDFVPFPVAGKDLVDCPLGPNLIQGQFYFYPSAGSPHPRAILVETARDPMDPDGSTATDAVIWPVDYEFSYRPYLYGPAMDFVDDKPLRGLRIAIPAGAKVRVGVVVRKIFVPTYLAAERLTFETEVQKP